MVINIARLRSRVATGDVLFTHLHGYESVVDHDFLSEKIRANRRFVLVAELLVHVLVHQ